MCAVQVFPLFGTLAFGIFSFYLLWCVVKGAMKFGIRLLIITIHPLKYVTVINTTESLGVCVSRTLLPSVSHHGECGSLLCL